MSLISRLLYVAIIVLLGSYTGQAQTKQSYPRFLYNGKNYNELITNRVPEYGIAARDGCVVMGEIQLELRDIDAEKIEGWVKDAATGDTLVGASIKIQRRNKHMETLATDSLGRFLMSKSPSVTELHVLYLGFRELNIRGLSGKLF
ncbi:hypothetical protein AB6805_24665 [Chitinophaga sp. RCC_12]|uniref:hypothetical protein n=1 Tax=Chitinophaga sp. RCC_12 TaxID=3239226 RepID=UPI0035269C04